MTVDEFWHSDVELLGAYEKAYYRDVSYRSWHYGTNIRTGVSLALSDGFGKKGQKAIPYPKYEDPFDNFPKTKEEIEKSHRELMLDQQNYLRSIIKVDE